MKCSCCDVILTTQEATRRFKGSGEFVDMCGKCLATIDGEVSYTKGNTEEDDEYEDEWEGPSEWRDS